MKSFIEKINLKIVICMGLVFLFAFINYHKLRDYYDETFVNILISDEDFLEQLRRENNAKYNKNIESQDIAPSRLRLNSLAALLMDGENNRVLYEINGYDQMSMASTTKIMTCIIALENGKLDDVVTVSSYAASMPDVKLNIRPGDQYYLKDLLYSLMLQSHNDVAVAIAEHIGGSVSGFATMMNDKARSLDCNNTNFVTPNGLDAEGHYTTAKDLALISSYAIKNKDFIEITNTSSYQFKELKKGTSYSVSNKNKFLYMMDGAIGIKTGFTGKAGYCFVGAIKKSDRTLISVVLGCGWPPSKTLKWTDTKRLMTYGIENYEKKQIFESIKLAPIYVKNGQTSAIGLSIEGDIKLLLRNDEKIRIEYNIPELLLAPIKAGQQVGTVNYYIDKNLYDEIPILTAEESKRIDYRFCFDRILRLWSHNNK